MRLLLLFSLATAALFGQGRTSGSSTSPSRAITSGATDPLTCTPTQAIPFFRNTTTPATKWCSSNNTWSAFGSGSAIGTVTSVGFTGGLISVATATTTPAFTVAGTSGGIPYFSSSSTWATSAALTASALVLGGGAGAAPTPMGSLGTTTTLLHGNAAGAPTFGAIVAADLPVVPLTAGTSVTLSNNSRYFVCTSTCTITVPVPAAGVQYCVYNDNNVATVITLAAIGSSSMYQNTARTAYGTSGTGTLVSSGVVGDAICIIGRDATHYNTLSFTGSWTAN